jgi:O-antigen/teichoic acid export membrane protein
MIRDGNLRLLRDFIALSGGQLLSKALGFFAFAYLARNLEPASYGAVEVAVAIAVFFGLIINCGLSAIGVRELAQDPKRLPALAAHIPAAKLLIALVAIPIMALSAFLVQVSDHSVLLVSLFAVALLAMPWQQEWLLQGLEMMGYVAAGQAIRMMTFALGVVVCVRGPHDLLQVGLVEIAAATTAIAYYLGVQHFRSTPIKLEFPGPELWRLIKSGFSVSLSQIVWHINQYVPMILVANMLDGTETAWFGSAHRIVMSLLIFSTIYHFNLYPIMARSLGEPNEALDRLLRPSFRVVAWAGILVGLALMLLAEPLLVLIYGERFSAAAPVLVTLVWVFPTTALSGHARWSLIAAGQQRFLLMAQTAGFGAMLLSGLVLIPRLQAVGGALSILVASLVVWGVSHAFATVHVGRLPFFTAIIRPVIVALASGLLGYSIASSLWMVATIATVTFIPCALVVDPDLLPDLRRLARAKADVEPRFGALPGKVS